MTTTAPERTTALPSQTYTESSHAAVRGTVNTFHGTPVDISREVALEAGITSNSDASKHFLIHVTAVTAGDISRANEYIGVNQLARWTSARTYEFIVGDPLTRTGEARGAIGVSGALLSPTLINGKVYSAHNSFTVQYFDEFHLPLRKDASNPFNILNFRGQEWGVPNDSTAVMPHTRYIEVEPPENAISLDSPVAVATTPEPVGQVVTRDQINSLTNASFSFFGEVIEHTRMEAALAGLGNDQTPLGLIVMSDLNGDTFSDGRLFPVVIPTGNTGHDDGRIFYSSERNLSPDSRNYVRGSMLSPELVSGKTYSSDGGFTVQYFGPGDESYRNDPARPFNVLNHRGEPSARTSVDPSYVAWYVEIVPPENAKAYPAVEAESEPAPRTQPQVLRDEELRTHLLETFALRDESGSFVTVPRNEVGHQAEVLMVDGSFVHTGFTDRDNDMVDVHRFVSATLPVEGATVYETTYRSQYVSPRDGMVYYQIKRTDEASIRLTAEQQASTIASLTSRVAASESRWDDMGEALNEMARNHSWCGEYEEAVLPLGWPGRHGDSGGTASYDMRISIDWSFSDSSTTSTQDDEFGSLTDIDTDEVSDFSIAEVTANGTASVMITRDLPRNQDDIDYSEYFDTSDLQELLPSGYEVDDWEVGETTLVD